MNNSKLYYVKSMKLAGFLMMRGFVLHGMERDKNTNYNVFLFTDTEKLSMAIKDYNERKVTNTLFA